MNTIQKIKPKLSADTIHTFLINLDNFDLIESESYLSIEEKERSEKIKFQKRQFIITRTVLRQLLANILNVTPDKVSFSYTSYLKPYISDKINEKNIQFNISHSKNFALIGISLETEIGIDIQAIDHRIEIQSLSNRFFSQREKEILNKLSGGEKLNAFYQIWTNKESFIKADGRGISFGLEKFSSLNINSPSKSKVITTKPVRGEWFTYNLECPKEYRAALTCNKPDIHIQTQWF